MREDHPIADGGGAVETLPPGFENWPRKHRIAYYDAVLDRKQIIAHIRSFIGSGSSGGPTPGVADRLTSEELAHVAGDLGAWALVEDRNPTNRR